MEDKDKKLSELLDLLRREKSEGATGGGVFGSFTDSPDTANDVDVVIIKEGVKRGGDTHREGGLHITELPPDVMEDKISTFGHQAVNSSRWLFGKKPEKK